MYLATSSILLFVMHIAYVSNVCLYIYIYILRVFPTDEFVFQYVFILIQICFKIHTYVTKQTVDARGNVINTQKHTKYVYEQH